MALHQYGCRAFLFYAAVTPTSQGGEVEVINPFTLLFLGGNVRLIQTKNNYQAPLLTRL